MADLDRYEPMSSAKTNRSLAAVLLTTMTWFANSAKAADRYDPNGIQAHVPQQAQDKLAPEPVPLAKPDSEQNLTETLKRNEGVLRPPEGNAEPMAIPPPNGSMGRMPVIPPPGSPGGDQSVRPK